MKTRVTIVMNWNLHLKRTEKCKTIGMKKGYERSKSKLSDIREQRTFDSVLFCVIEDITYVSSTT